MKLSTKKILVVAAGTLVLTSATLLIPHAILREYLQVAVLALAIAANVILLGWARPRTASTKTLAILIILAAAVYQIVIFLLLGLKLGFVSNVYGWNLTSWLKVILPIVLAIFGEEILRGQLIEKGKNSHLAVVMTGMVIWLVQLIIVLPLYNLSSAQNWFILVVVVAGTGLLENILLTYVAYQYDYRINLGYRLMMDLPVYLLPILPDAGEYLPSIFRVGFVFLLTLGLVNMHRSNKAMALNTTKQSKSRQTEQQLMRRRICKWAGVGVLSVMVVSFVALMSGLFHYHLLAIGSGSMSPSIERGDLVLVEKTKDYDEMQAGEVLVYQHSNVVMVHRITEVKQDGMSKVFITKGDANGVEDQWQVKPADIIGVARGRISALGFPTLWLNELFNRN